MQRISTFLFAVSCLTLACYGQVQPSHVKHVAKPAQIVKSVPLVYPQEGIADQIQGAVELEVKVDKQGNVAKVTALSGPPKLIQAAIDNVKQWKYSPATLDGVPVPAVQMEKVQFQLK